MSIFVGKGGLSFTSTPINVGSPTGSPGGLVWTGIGQVVP